MNNTTIIDTGHIKHINNVYIRNELQMDCLPCWGIIIILIIISTIIIIIIMIIILIIISDDFLSLRTSLWGVRTSHW